MSLDEKYDSFYKSTQQKETLDDVVMCGWPKNRVQAIVALASSADIVLDVGCGNGLLLYQLRRRFKKLVGLEYSNARLEQAKMNLYGLPFDPILGSAEDMRSIGTKTIDCVVSADTIEHIPDVYVATGEIFRVLKPGGTLLINTPNVAFAKKRVQLLLGRFPSTSQPNEGLGSDVLFDGGHFHYFTFRSLSLLLQKAGFQIVKAMGYGRLGRVHNLYPPLLSGGIQLVAIRPL